TMSRIRDSQSRQPSPGRAKSARRAGSTRRWVTAVVVLAGCSSDGGLAKLPPPVVQIDELQQRSAAEVDILWVVDDSPSVADKQKLLADNFSRFITGLTACQGTGMAN